MSSQVERYDPFDGALGFSLATRVGDLVFTAGCFGMDTETFEVPDDLEAEAELAFDMAVSVLGAFGSTLSDVTDMTTFIVGDLSVVYPPFQAVRTRRLAGHLPTSASIGATALVDPRLHYEIKMIATTQR